VTASLYGPAFFAGRSHTVTQSAQAVVPHLKALLNPQSVLDVGCGQGEWLDELELVDSHGVDIALYYPTDLTEPLHLGRTFDLVLCLETGEHLPEWAADTLVDSIVRHVGHAAVFGAAVPGQHGTGHINCQPHEYWHGKFAARGFEMFDAIRPLIANDARVSPWYRNNMFLYRRAAPPPPPSDYESDYIGKKAGRYGR
jgi:SAM-dependent methyltransferase